MLFQGIGCLCMAVWQLLTLNINPSTTLARQAMHESEGSEYDRLFYPFLCEGGKASIEDVLAQVRHSTLEKCREVIELRRATLEHSGERIVEAGQAIAQAFASGATLFAFGNGGSTTDAQDMVPELLNPPFAGWSPL